MHSLNHIETAHVLWVFAKWAALPSPGWLAAYLAHLPSQLLLSPPHVNHAFVAVVAMQFC
jgi:hypothetical protein